MSSPAPDLLLVNIRPSQPIAGAGRPGTRVVAVKDGLITAVALSREESPPAGHSTRVVDCRGLTLIPGFVDAHCHLLALAASLQGLDCRPPQVSSIPRLQQSLQKRSLATPPGRWVRGFGYDHQALSERRHPTRWDLDPFSAGRPVRLDHRSGHASVLNSRAMELAGIADATPDPVDGVIDRDPATGRPTGLLLEMGAYLRRKLASSQSREEFQEGVRLLGRSLLEYGVTSVHDAGPGNSLDRWHTFKELRYSGLLSCRVTMMAGFPHLEEFRNAGLGFGSGGPALRLGHAKIMLTMTTGSLQPGVDELEEKVRHAHALGFPVAVHAVEQEAVAVVARVLAKTRPSRGALAASDRIEHCSECPASLVAEVAGSGASVVTQPGLVYWQGDGYLAGVEPELINHLYPAGALLRAGVNVAFGSDAPVTGPNPWPAIYGAVTRKTRSGALLSSRNSGDVPWQGITVNEALQMHTGWTLDGSPAGRTNGIRKGSSADLVLLNTDPLEVGQEGLKDIRAVMTIIGGRIAWEADQT